MIEFTHSKFHDNDFSRAFGKLASHTGFNPQLAYQIKRVRDKVEIAMRESQPVFKALVEKYAVLDEDGQVVMDEKTGDFQIREGCEQDYMKEKTMFDSQVVKIDKDKLQAVQLNGAGLTPNEIGALEEFIDGLV